MSEQANMAAHYEHEIPEGYEAKIEGNKVIIVQKEDEDERIRKELIEQVAYILPNKEEYDDEGRVLPAYHKRIEQYRAYLEKQKEQKPAEWNEEDEARKERLISIVKRALHGNEYCLLSDKGATELITWLKALHERINLQPKQEWSKEDLQHKSWILECLADGERKMPEYAEDFRAAYKWLKFLSPQPKQDVLPSLREKEIICLKRALDYLRKEHNRYGGEDFTNEIAVLEWLITHPILVSDTHWKPSKEQITALNCAIQTMRHQLNLGDKRLLSLYDDLKKLM